ncbi:Remorin_C domain-containing protein [Cephalotus follicularis]|uniref:Remorin_C domain-containing protein n=1 Tax=Cephalotus follicularis TaxID=3775 RepID=A0A1Q3ANG3_CEPFO|nr:Remorin_C domain-containing protein [Cephalotus follicularis]
MLTLGSAINNDQTDLDHHHHDHDEDEHVRDIHALTPSRPVPPVNRRRWDSSSSVRSSSLSMSSEAASSENFTTISREFNALVLAGSTIDQNGGNDFGNNIVHGNNNNNNNNNNNQYLSRIGEEEVHEETNPLAIVPDNNPPMDNPAPDHRWVGSVGGSEVTSVQRVKKEEVEAKISAWQNAKIAKINNRFKREDAVINGWEGEQVQKTTSWMKKVERKLEEKRLRALEKMENDIAKAHRKAEERRASAEAKRGTKVARVLEIANLMRAVGRPPVKRSFF